MTQTIDKAIDEVQAKKAEGYPVDNITAAVTESNRIFDVMISDGTKWIRVKAAGEAVHTRFPGHGWSPPSEQRDHFGARIVAFNRGLRELGVPQEYWAGLREKFVPKYPHKVSLQMIQRNGIFTHQVTQEVYDNYVAVHGAWPSQFANEAVQNMTTTAPTSETPGIPSAFNEAATDSGSVEDAARDYVNRMERVRELYAEGDKLFNELEAINAGGSTLGVLKKLMALAEVREQLEEAEGAVYPAYEAFKAALGQT